MSPLNLPAIPEQCRPLFMALIQILQTKHSQLEFLSKERKLLEDRINLQHHLWSEDLASFRDAIVESERVRKRLKLSLLLESARSDLIIGMKERDALLYKLKLEYIEGDMEDMKMYIKLPNNKNIQSEHKYSGLAVKEDAQHELRRLKHEYEKLACQKETEVSALVSERDFVWNQLKRMEDEYIILLKRKCKELESARVHIGNLEHEMKKLESTTKEKDTIIANLNGEIIESNVEVGRLSLRLSDLSRNLETVMIAKDASATPLNAQNFDTGEHGLPQVQNIANRPDEVHADKMHDEDVRSMDNLLMKLKEMSKEMEIKSIENENLRLLCSELEHQLNKQKNHLKNASAPKEVVSRNLIDELTTASSKDGDGKLPAKICYQRRKVLKKAEPPNGPSLVGSRTPEFGEGTKVPKGSRSLSKKRRKSESKIGRQSLFSSAFKVPKLKASHSVVL